MTRKSVKYVFKSAEEYEKKYKKASSVNYKRLFKHETRSGNLLVYEKWNNEAIKFFKKKRMKALGAFTVTRLSVLPDALLRKLAS